MNERVFIALGKSGDILSILPILYQEKQKTKELPRLLVSAAYASVLNGVSYVNPMVWPGSFFDLAGAVKLIKAMGFQAVPLQVYGRDWPFEKLTPSFQLDQWHRAGVVEHFHDWPLVIDRRNRHRERKLAESAIGKRPYILLADHSESSPFPYKNRLTDLLTANFGRTHDVRLASSVRALHLTDFIGLYERADAFVTIETSHLHLSRAINKPLIALTTETPSRWHGSAWHPRMAFQCRYGDFPWRSDELIKSVGMVLSDKDGPETNQVVTKFAHGYNPTCIEGSPIMVYRYHPYQSWMTRLALDDGYGSTHTITLPTERFDQFSHEDARLFMFNGKLHISLVLAMSEFREWKCVVGYGELTQDEHGWSVQQIWIPKYGRNDFSALEKNWLFFEHDGRLLFIYGNSPDQTVVEVREDKCPMVFHAPRVEWKYGEIRGGCMIPWKGNLLRFFHSHTKQGARDSWIYAIGVAVMESRPPFKVLKVSQTPVIAGNEKYITKCHHWKANVAFPGGVQQEGAGWRLLYGFNDCQCVEAHLTEKDLNL